MKHSMIKAPTGFRSMKPEVVFNTSQAIYNALNGNADIPAPPAPFDLPTLLAANQALSAANSDALDGGKKAVAVRNHCKGVVVKILDQIARYVQANCKDDMTIFLSSGLKAQSSTKTAPATASDAIRYVKPGPMSGQAQVKLVADRNAGACSHGMDNSAGHECPVGNSHQRLDARYHLRVPGSCRHPVRLYGLE